MARNSRRVLIAAIVDSPPGETRVKCSVGVAVFAVVVLLGSAVALAAGAGGIYMFLGPISGQLFDASSLPPGADLRTMRAAGVFGASMVSLFGVLGVATGVGLIRLWRWARYSAIAFGVCVAGFSVLSAAFTMFVPLPSAPSGGPELAGRIRIAMVVFYGVWAAVGGVFVWFFLRARTKAEFSGASSDDGPRVRPISITIIAWLMIVSGVMMLPTMFLMHPPAILLGLVLTGRAAQVFYLVYSIAYLVIGVGLLKRTSQALMPAIALHSFALVNALTMLLPGIWSRYQDAAAAASPMMAGAAQQSSMPAMRYGAVGMGIAVAGTILYFLREARRRDLSRS